MADTTNRKKRGLYQLKLRDPERVKAIARAGGHGRARAIARNKAADKEHDKAR